LAMPRKTGQAGNIDFMGEASSFPEAAEAPTDSGARKAELGCGPWPVSVAVVDDHELVRAGTRQILETDGRFDVVCDCADPEQALVALGERSGIELARRITEASPGTAVVMLSAYDDDDYVAASLGAGVRGYLLKTAPAEELVRAVEAASRGTTVLDPKVTVKLARISSNKHPLSDLTARELDVMAYLAHGCPNKVIALELNISLRTVEGHIGHIFEKTGATSRTELALMASRAGLGSRISPPMNPASVQSEYRGVAPATEKGSS
jgi:DNA-binding NarL/FixJ family response regulator